MNISHRILALAAVALLCCLSSTAAQRNRPAYRDPGRPVDERVRDLLRRMTLEEKVAQTVCLWQRKPYVRNTPNLSTDRGDFSPEKAREVMPHGIGQIARQRELKDPRASAEYANAAQRWLRENTRLGIPAIFHDEALHGHMASGSTVFPVPLALSCSWDPELITRIFTAAALEARARGGHHVLGPNLDLARDPRWGRTEETYGEDPYLVSRMGVAVVRALQGGITRDRPAVDANHVIATGKHFAGHGQPEAGTNIGPVNLSERLLRETHLASFEAAVKEAYLQSIMPAYHEIDGVPVHANSWMLEEVLRSEWGFDGLVVSDYNGIAELQGRHRVAEDKASAARQALEAGVDVELPDPDCYPRLLEEARSGRLPRRLLDQAVARVLRAKFLLGLFENPFVDPERAVRVTNSADHRALAREAARRSIVLLKNDGGLLPLDRTALKSIALIGPNAAGVHLGGYTDPLPPKGVSILEGVRAAAPGLRVEYAEGVKITKEGGNWFADRATLNDEADDRRLIAEAVAVARRCDLVILVIGGNEDTNKEAWADNHLGDRDSLELVGRQEDLFRAMMSTGKPVVVFLINGGPLAIRSITEQAPAILEGFYLGQETGTAAAEVLFGDTNPGGKLTVTFPRSAGQLPVFYNRKPSAKRGYLFSTTEPLFPFGHGLSYTTFSYSSLRVSPTTIPPGGEAQASVTVMNTGRRRGDEVVQMYLRDEVSSVTRPVRELKDFVRVTLEPGQSRTVTFRITPDKLSFYDRRMRRVVEPGAFQVMVGGSSNTTVSTQLDVKP